MDESYQRKWSMKLFGVDIVAPNALFGKLKIEADETNHRV